MTNGKIFSLFVIFYELLFENLTLFLHFFANFVYNFNQISLAVDKCKFVFKIREH
jgi:hypothetical protein